VSRTDRTLTIELMAWKCKQSDLESSPLLRGLPIALKRIDIHAEWVSKAVLDLMGELPETVEGGEIIRDDQGNPTGVFVSVLTLVSSMNAWLMGPVNLPCRPTMQSS
jgi:predicted amidohydrolase YtcJ